MTTPVCWPDAIDLSQPTGSPSQVFAAMLSRLPRATGINLSADLTGSFSLSTSWGQAKNAGVQGNVTGGVNVTLDELVDVNGDGLPDRVSAFTDNLMFVRMNTGRGFATPILLRSQSWANVAGDAGLPFMRRDANGHLLLQLPNGQELDFEQKGLDIMKGVFGKVFGTSGGNVPSPDELHIGIRWFMKEVAEHGTIPEALSMSTTLSGNFGGGGGNGTDFDLGPIIFAIGYSVGGDGNASLTWTDVMFTDIDGDGLPEPVRRVIFPAGGPVPGPALAVKRNPMGLVNKLVKVTNPLGGEMSFTYGREGCVRQCGH